MEKAENAGKIKIDYPWKSTKVYPSTLLKLEQKLGLKTFRGAHSISKTEVKRKKKAENLDDDGEPACKKLPKRAFIKKVPVPRRPRAIDPRFNPRARTYKEKRIAKSLIQRMENQKRKLASTNLNQWLKDKDGKKYFPTKEETLAKELVHKYEELKESGLIN